MILYIDEKSHTEMDEDSDFEEPLDMIDSDEMCINKSSFLQPEWFNKIKTLKEKVSDSEVIIAQDTNSEGTKQFAIFNSHQQVLDYSDKLPAEHRVFYENPSKYSV